MSDAAAALHELRRFNDLLEKNLQAPKPLQVAKVVLGSDLVADPQRGMDPTVMLVVHLREADHVKQDQQNRTVKFSPLATLASRIVSSFCCSST